MQWALNGFKSLKKFSLQIHIYQPNQEGNLVVKWKARIEIRIFSSLFRKRTSLFGFKSVLPRVLKLSWTKNSIETWFDVLNVMNRTSTKLQLQNTTNMPKNASKGDKCAKICIKKMQKVNVEPIKIGGIKTIRNMYSSSYSLNIYQEKKWVLKA